jgi:hypothetical protein
VEFDPCATNVAQDFKQAWIAKYGKWEGPELMGTGTYAALRAALMQTGSFDPDVLANLISNGMKFEGPTGAGQMVSRPDLGNNRTVDSVATTYIKVIKDGKPILIDTLQPDVALQYFRLAFPSK